MNGLGTISSRSATSKTAETKELSLGKISKDDILGEDELLAEILDVSLQEISDIADEKVPIDKKERRRRGKRKKNKV